MNPSLAEYANLCGARGYRVSDADALDDTRVRALRVDGPTLVDIETDAALL